MIKQKHIDICMALWYNKWKKNHQKSL